MAHEMMIVQSNDDLRWQRRILFSAHIAAYLLFCVVQAALLPNDLFALSLRSLLFMTIILHVSWLCSTTRPLLSDWTAIKLVPQPIPLLPEGQRQNLRPELTDDGFWYRWHDV